MDFIPEYSTYSVTRDGRVWSNRLRKGWLTPNVDKNGYHRIHMIGDSGKRKGVYAHQIVALVYIPNPENKLEVNHLDHNKSNNCVENLAWCTHRENIQHDWANGKRRPNYSGQKYSISLIKRIRRMFNSGKYTQMEISRMFSIPQPTIYVIVRHKTWENI